MLPCSISSRRWNPSDLRHFFRLRAYQPGPWCQAWGAPRARLGGPAGQPVTSACRLGAMTGSASCCSLPRGSASLRGPAARASQLHVGCRLALRCCRRVAAILTEASGVQHPATRCAHSAEVCGTAAERHRIRLLGQRGTQRSHRLGGSSMTCTSGGGSKRKSDIGGWRFTSTWLNETRVTLPTRSKTAVSRISPEAGSARSCSRS